MKAEAGVIYVMDVKMSTKTYTKKKFALYVEQNARPNAMKNYWVPNKKRSLVIDRLKERIFDV